MTRRAAMVACLLGPAAAQAVTWQAPMWSKFKVRLLSPKTPSDPALYVRWSDGSEVTLTEASVRAALEER